MYNKHNIPVILKQTTIFGENFDFNVITTDMLNP